jgi:hypothetical protein
VVLATRTKLFNAARGGDAATLRSSRSSRLRQPPSPLSTSREPKAASDRSITNQCPSTLQSWTATRASRSSLLQRDATSMSRQRVLALWSGHRRCILAARCTIDSQEKNGFTTLNFAAKKGQSRHGKAPCCSLYIRFEGYIYI